MSSALFSLSLQMYLITLPFKYHLTHIAIYFISWFILGSSVLFLANSFGVQLPFSAVIDVILVFVASYLMGLIAITLPSGLGILELDALPVAMVMCFTYLLMPWVPTYRQGGKPIKRVLVLPIRAIRKFTQLVFLFRAIINLS